MLYGKVCLDTVMILNNDAYPLKLRNTPYRIQSIFVRR